MGKENKRLTEGLTISGLFAILGLFAPLTPAALPIAVSFGTDTGTQETYTAIVSEGQKTLNTVVVKEGDLNDNGIPADAGDLTMLKDAATGKIERL